MSVSDVELSPSSIEFGACTTYESVVSTVSITNHSCLPLDFGFIQLPKVRSLYNMDVADYMVQRFVLYIIIVLYYF